MNTDAPRPRLTFETPPDLPHLQVDPENVAEWVLLPGDPGRVPLVGEYLEDFEVFRQNREFAIGTGSYGGNRVTVCSTGIGSASTEIALVELAARGATTVLRIGGCGALWSEIRPGDLILHTGAVGDGGATQYYAPPNYPAFSDADVVLGLRRACQSSGAIFHEGLGASVSSYFNGQGRAVVAGSEVVELSALRDLGVLSLDMEAATVLTIGRRLGLQVGSICVAHANRVSKEWATDYDEDQRKLIRTALSGLTQMQEELA